MTDPQHFCKCDHPATHHFGNRGACNARCRCEAYRPASEKRNRELHLALARKKELRKRRLDAQAAARQKRAQKKPAPQAKKKEPPKAERPKFDWIEQKHRAKKLRSMIDVWD